MRYEKFMSKNPTLIGVVDGVKYYEDPDYGDEGPLMYVKGGKVFMSEFWDLPSLEEALGEMGLEFQRDN